MQVEEHMTSEQITVLSLMQPWAQLVVLGAKRYETRPWTTKYRGRLAIHASKTFPKFAREFLYLAPFKRVLMDAGYQDIASYPTGAIIGTVDLVDIVSINDALRQTLSKQERAFGDYADGRYAWLLERPVLFREPIPATGRLGLWTFALSTMQQVSV